MQTSRAAKNPNLQAKIEHMRLSLAPLVCLTTGKVHPCFPSTILNFWLLTAEQCDELAHFYHQRTPSEWTKLYPCPVKWSSDATLEEKRLMIGRFIGLRGCESPVKVQTEAEIMQEVRNASARASEEDEVWRGKNRWY